MGKTVVDIFGEIHTPEERDRVEDLIRERNKKNPYAFLLSEEMGNYSCLTKSDKEHFTKKFNGSSRSLELAIELDIPVIGIDLLEKEVYAKDTKNDLSNSFLLRETNMVGVILYFMERGNCAVIVGDTHLRTVKTKMLGDISKIVKELGKKSNINIFRSPIKEID